MTRPRSTAARSLLPPLLLLLLLGAAPARAATAWSEEIRQHYETELEELFLWFHRNPELSFLEHETSARLARELRDLGVDVTDNVGGTGLVGMIENGPGPLLLIRADMDGLPLREDSGLPYASTATQENRDGEEVPVMHACGHDVHITSLVGTARMLLAHRDLWRGTVMLVGQPAEERIGGARAMLEDGLYERFGVPDHAIAFHVSSDGPAGRLAVAPGLVMSSSDSVDITVHGVGAHGASPHRGKDPIYIASQIVIALQGLVSREIAPLEPAVVTVGSFHAGFKHNIIPDEARLQLTVRSDSEATRTRLLEGIERIARNVGRAAGLPEDRLPTVRSGFESTPTTINDDAATARVRSAWVEHFGEDILYRSPRTGMGAEDFAEFVQTRHEVPGVYFSVGGTPEATLQQVAAGEMDLPSHHSPFFRIDPEPSVTRGIEASFVAALELLAAP
ncbi:MAG: amidohydrolase [Gammaproteobacteria bacterium]|nr:amidohydrolase [Gammaproteobacteria bacterium]